MHTLQYSAPSGAAPFPTDQEFSVKHKVQEELTGVLTFVGIIWAVYFADFVLPGNLTDWGLVPRTWWGLPGIPAAPFLHANLAHLVSNTVPLLVLLTLLAGSRTRTWETVFEIILLGGGLLWLFGRAGSEGARMVHVGASGLVYGLIAFLIVAGFREKRLASLAVALVVGFLYGTTLLSGVLPSVGSQVSWDGHLWGAIAGGGLAFATLGPTRGEKPD